jgi:hypothetical protein
MCVHGPRGKVHLITPNIPVQHADNSLTQLAHASLGAKVQRVEPIEPCGTRVVVQALVILKGGESLVIERVR